jgi:CHAD domain-containing protein
VLEALDSDRYLALLRGLDALTPSGRRNPVPRRLDRARARVRKAADAADAAPPEGRDEAFHEVRKAAKRARYAAEAAGSALGRPAKRRAKRLAKRMTALQGLLGEHHDTVAAREVLRTMGAHAYLAGENGFSFGRLHALEERRGEDLLREYPRLRRAALR